MCLLCYITSYKIVTPLTKTVNNSIQLNASITFLKLIIQPRTKDIFKESPQDLEFITKRLLFTSDVASQILSCELELDIIHLVFGSHSVWVFCISQKK